MHIEWYEDTDHRGTPYKEANFYSENLGIEGYFDIEVRQYSVNTFITLSDLSADSWEGYTHDGEGSGRIGWTPTSRFRLPNSKFNTDPKAVIAECINAWVTGTTEEWAAS